MSALAFPSLNFKHFKGEGVLLNYQLVMNWLLRMVTGCHILKRTPTKDKFFALVCSIEESCKSSKSRPFLTNHVTRIGKKKKLSNIKGIEIGN